MVGLKVQLYLKTPLFPFHYEEDGKRFTFPSNIVVLEGTLKEEGYGGLRVDVVRGGPADGPLKEVPGLTEAIIPSGKVDFVRVLG